MRHSSFDVTPEFAQHVRERHAAGKPFTSHEIGQMSEHQYKHMLDDAASMQRGAPESHMVRMQMAMGGGVLGGAIEHVGDLYHRIGEAHAQVGFPNPPEAVLEKIPRVLYYLTHPYGFAKEHAENIASNRQHFTLHPRFDANGTAIKYPSNEEIESMGREYARLHGQLPSYTPALHTARAASMSLGKGMYWSAVDHLTKLQEMTRSRESWYDAMSQEAAVKHLQRKR